MVYFLIGFMGAGKTTVGKLLADQLGVVFSDVDQQIEKKENLSVSEIFALYGEAYFRKLESEFINSSDFKDAVISCGGGLPCYNSLMEKLFEKGKVIYLKAKAETLILRLEKETVKRPLLSGENLANLVNDRLSERESCYSKADLIIETDQLNTFQISAKIIAELS